MSILSSLLTLLLLAGLIRLWRTPGRWALWAATLATLGLGLYGFHWIFISLNHYGNMVWPVAGGATVALGAYVASFGLLAGLAVRRWLPGPLATAGLITAAEMLRGVLLTGFPWFNWGYGLVDSPLAGFVPIVGVYGLVFVGALAAAWLALLRLRGLVIATGLHATGALLGLLSFTQPVGQPLTVALLQGQIEQDLKFDPAEIARNEQLHLAMMDQALQAAAPDRLDLMVLPETAFVYPWRSLEPGLKAGLRSRVEDRGYSLITGIPSRDPDGWANSAIALLPGGVDPRGYEFRYDKHHLVPFGEFIPWGFEWFVALMDMPLGSFKTGAPRQDPVPIGDQRIGLNICFEDLFGEEIRRSLLTDLPATQRPTILLNLSNLAWFGDTIALDQHLAISRMRALETGRPMIRATNTGVTAHIQPNGEVTLALPVYERGTLLTRVQGTEGDTPFLWWGNAPALLLSLAGIALAVARRRRLPR